MKAKKFAFTVTGRVQRFAPNYQAVLPTKTYTGAQLRKLFKAVTEPKK